MKTVGESEDDFLLRSRQTIDILLTLAARQTKNRKKETPTSNLGIEQLFHRHIGRQEKREKVEKKGPSGTRDARSSVQGRGGS